jgi:hypothetical protein
MNKQLGEAFIPIQATLDKLDIDLINKQENKTCHWILQHPNVSPFA